MISKAEIKRIRALASKKQRHESGLFVVEGEKMVEEALASQFEVEAVYRIGDVTEAEMAQMTMLSSPSPALAVVRIPDSCDADGLASRMTEGHSLCLALDSVRDPGNLGTIIRIADWFGIDAIFASEDTVELYNPKVVQATMGAIFRRKVVYCDLPRTLRQFREAGLPVWGTFLDGADIYKETLSKEGVIVMGSESFGIGAACAAEVTDRLYIPPYPRDASGSESLNVAIATAVTCALFRASAR
ncbi:MAG: RNA methyltransferase [Bacteroidales bacterium]|nr:RNA methyltransferase [Bacteroidales bacterium]